MELCLDNTVCHKWFTADGHLVCKHGVCEKDFGDCTGVKVVCPLELQRLHEERKWAIFWEKKNELIENFMKERGEQT